jgi:hypothetical protein
MLEWKVHDITYMSIVLLVARVKEPWCIHTVSIACFLTQLATILTPIEFILVTLSMLLYIRGPHTNVNSHKLYLKIIFGNLQSNIHIFSSFSDPKMGYVMICYIY